MTAHVSCAQQPHASIHLIGMLLGAFALLFNPVTLAGAQDKIEDKDPSQPEWIWLPAESKLNQKAFFALSFELEAPAVITDGAFVGDDAFSLWMDGKPQIRAAASREPVWIKPGAEIQAGRHDLCVSALNLGIHGGVLGYILFTLENGKELLIHTSSDWTAWEAKPPDWPKPSQPWSQSGSSSRSLGTVAEQSTQWAGILKHTGTPDASDFSLPSGFVCEKIYSAHPNMGSFVSMTFSNDGRLFVCGEKSRLYSFSLSGQLLSGEPAQKLLGAISLGAHTKGLSALQRVPFPIHSAQGLEWANDSLYAVVVTPPEDDGGLHRLRDTNGDGLFDEHIRLSVFGTDSEHGPHAVRQGPDGMLYLLTGNYTRFPAKQPTSGLPPNVQEDVLLPRIWDPLGHAKDIFAPGGQLWRTDLDGRSWEQVVSGLRNPYDLAFSPSGEAFTFDADMEWDLGTPWYRSPRLLHLVPGAEYGWRAGTAKWPASFIDSLPPVAETDLASPTGLEFGTKSSFSSAFQTALFMGDWAWGRILIAQLTPKGASYSAVVQTFLEGRGVAITDLEIGPDGWLWFIIGGRGTQSAIYRVRQTDPKLQATSAKPRSPHKTRIALESPDCSLETALKSINDQDRFLASAARLVLERTPPDQWLPETGALPPHLALALARAWPEVFESGLLNGEFECGDWFRTPLAEAYALSPADTLAAIRVAMVIHMRLTRGTKPTERAWAQDLLRSFPSNEPLVDREVARLLTALEAEGLPALFLQQMVPEASQEHQLHFALLLRLVDHGWTPSSRLKYFKWFQGARSFQGGASQAQFLDTIHKEALTRVPTAERRAILALGKMPKEPVPPNRNRPFIRDWTVPDLLDEIQALKSSADADRGSLVFSQASCLQCHRINAVGGSLGPDLTSAARRFTETAILEAIITPELAVSDQYKLVRMPRNLLDTFSVKQISDLLKFLEVASWPQSERDESAPVRR